MKVRLSDVAERDIEAIGDAVARTDPARAVQTIEQFRKAAKSIGRAPKLPPPVPQSHIPRLRKKRAGSYLTLYQLNADEALVLRVAHERSDWMSLV